MAVNFSALSEHAIRRYRFAQGDAIHLVLPAFSNGVCMGIVLNWIKEKLSTSNGFLRLDGPVLKLTKKNFANPSSSNSILMNSRIDQRNKHITKAGSVTHTTYVNESRDGAARKLNLVAASYEPKIIPKQGPAPAFLQECITDETIAQTGINLPKGHAVIIEVENEKHDGHVIAFYRSRGGTLYFFDPNAGVYEINDTGQSNMLGFVRAWLRVYATQEKPIEWTTGQKDWYAVFNRTGS
jgi:hypothetical protein